MARVDVVGVTKRPKERVREAVARAVKARVREVKLSIEGLEKSSKNFEARYGMTTEVFYKR